MNSFWVKMAVFAVIVGGLVIFVKNFSSSLNKPAKETKTLDQVWEEDEKKFRVEPESGLPPESRETRLVSADERPVEQPKPQYRKLSEIEQIDAERLLNVAIQHRKIGRLPGTGYKTMVDCCRQIIEKYPGSIYAYNARKMLGDIPERFRSRYKITDEEIKLDN